MRRDDIPQVTHKDIGDFILNNTGSILPQMHDGDMIFSDNYNELTDDMVNKIVAWWGFTMYYDTRIHRFVIHKDK